METYFDESLIPAHNGENFVVEKVNKQKNESDWYTMSLFKYKQDVLHQRYNHEIPAKNFAGDGGGCCGWDVTAAQYDGLAWADILYLGLYLGNAPDYIYKNKSVDSLDVIESDQEIIDYVTWIDNDINVIQHNEWTYNTSKQYNIIICDLWAVPGDVTQDHKTKLLNNYSNNLKIGGKIIIPISGETIN
jgi:hypothetical protein|tara:strand:+ start:77 stop:643 length:567 start_codon:yes stop_codon:yes gene_type:complete